MSSRFIPDAVEKPTVAEIAQPVGSELEPGSRVGRYIVLHRAGAGAMGVVYAAHDPELDRRVAIKLLHASCWNDAGRSRVLGEARAMAKLNHPNVVGVFEVGTLGEQMFVAMEFAEGVTLHEWLAAKPRRWRQVVDVLAELARGLAAAHDAGIVHRDIKPTNIIVTSAGTARLLDFGLAHSAAPSHDAAPHSGVFASGEKARSQAADARGFENAGTPAYMAPELSHGFATAKSDQYAFCATLYEALFGRRPDAVRAASVTRYENPGRPAPELDERLLRKGGAIPTWLWRVIRRGLSTHPEARHASMHVLADELSQRPEQERTKRLVLAAVLGGLALVAVATTRTFSSRPRDPCAGAASAARQVWGDTQEHALTQAFSSVKRPYAAGTAQRISRLLDARTQAWTTMRRDTCAATLVNGTQSQHLMDLRMSCLDRRLSEQAALTRLLVRGADADVVDSAMQAVSSLPSLSACADARALQAAYPPPADPALARKVDALKGKIDQARALRLAGKYGAAVALLAPERMNAQALEHPPLTAELLLELATAQAEEGSAEDAEHTVSQALPAAALAHDDVLMAYAMAKWIWVVGYLQDRHAEALATGLLAEAVALRAGPGSEAQAEVRVALGSAHLNQGDYAAARTAFESSLQITEQRFALDDPRRGRALSNLGLVVSYQGKDEEAIPYLRKAIAVSEAALGADHPRVAIALNNLGLSLRSLGQDAEARACFERALATWEAAHGPNHPDVAMALSNLAVSLRHEGRLDEAKVSAERALAIRMHVHGADNHRTALCMADLGRILLEGKDYRASQQTLERALSVLEKALSPEHPFTVAVRVDIARAMLALGHALEAAQVLEPALVLAEREELDELGDVQLTLARALWPATATRQRAVSLVTKARDRLQQKDVTTADEKVRLGELEAWLLHPSSQG